MRKIFALALAASLTAGVAYRVKDTLGDLGLTSEEVKNTVFENLQSDWMHFPSTGKMREMARRIPAGSRGAAIQALGGVVKAYVGSEAFRARYNEYVEQTYKVDGPASEAEIKNNRAAYDQAMDAQMQNARMAYAGLESIPDNMVPTMVQQYLQVQERELAGAQGARKELLRKDIAELKQLNTTAAAHPAEARKALVAMMMQGMAGAVEEARGEADKEQQQALQKLDGTKKQLAVREAHRDYKKVVRERLRAFLTLSATVDFDAKLKQSGSTWYFVNPAYEQQTEQWKFLYRIGKEPVMAARAFAADWLRELDAKAE
jgi:hypothetical protein